MKKYLLVDSIEGQGVLSETIASSARVAQSDFDKEGWAIGTVISEEEYLKDLKNECELNALESISFE